MSSPSSNECNISSDCTFQAPRGITVIKFCFEEVIDSDEVFFCDCSPWFGWTGENCDGGSFQLSYFRFTVLLALVITSPGFLLLCFEVWSYLKAKSKAHHRVPVVAFRKMSDSNPMHIAVPTIVGLFLLILYAFLNALAAFDPTKFQVQRYHFLLAETAVVEDVVPIGGLLWDSVLVLAFYMLLIASTQVAMSWIDLAQSFPQMFDDLNSSVIRFFRKFVGVANSIFLILAIILLATAYISIAIILCAILSLILLTSFALARYRFSKFANQLSDEQQKLTAHAIEMIKFSSRIHILMIGVMVVALISHGATVTATAYYIPAGDFHYPLFLKDISIFAGTSLLLCDVWYIRIIFKGLKTRYETLGTAISTRTNNNRSASGVHT